MAIGTTPDFDNGVQLRKIITTSGWYDLGAPRRFIAVLAGGGGGGGASGATNAGGGGGGGAGVLCATLFIGGRVYFQIGAGGTTDTPGNSSYMLWPQSNQDNGASSGIYLGGIAAGGGGAGGGTSGVGRSSIPSDNRPTITGYFLSGSYLTAGDGGSSGGGGSRTSVTNNATFAKNINGSGVAPYINNWVNNSMYYYAGSGGTSVSDTLFNSGYMPGVDPFSSTGLSLVGTSTSYGLPNSLWTNQTVGATGRAYGGAGGSSGAPEAINGNGGMFAGGGGGGAGTGSYSGAGGSGAFYRGGEGAWQLGSVLYAGSGGAGIAGPGATSALGTSANGATGGAGGLGGGGGGGGKSGTATSGSGGVGGNGACLIFW